VDGTVDVAGGLKGSGAGAGAGSTGGSVGVGLRTSVGGPSGKGSVTAGGGLVDNPAKKTAI